MKSYGYENLELVKVVWLVHSEISFCLRYEYKTKGNK